MGTCHRGLNFHSFLPTPSAPLQGAGGVYRRKHLRSRGWPPHCGRLIRVECTSFGQRTPITATAPTAQCGRTSDSPGPASSALSSHQALSVPSLNYILFTNTRPDFRWSLNKGWQRSGPRHEDVICLCALADKRGGGGGGGTGLILEIAQKNACWGHVKSQRSSSSAQEELSGAEGCTQDHAGLARTCTKGGQKTAIINLEWQRLELTNKLTKIII